jgi:hypothetical protein
MGKNISDATIDCCLQLESDVTCKEFFQACKDFDASTKDDSESEKAEDKRICEKLCDGDSKLDFCGLSSGTIAGIVIAVIAGVAVAEFLIYWFGIRKKTDLSAKQLIQ